MYIEILSIGSELLKGTTVNTNACSLGKALLEKGYKVTKQITLLDDAKEMKHAILDAMKRADLVICTGGLGATLDDITKEVLCDVFHTQAVFNAELAQTLKSRFGDFPSIEEQATVPRGAQILENKIGTAPGLIFLKQKKALIALPGVPRDMFGMLSDMLSWVEEYFPISTKWHVKKYYYCLLKEDDLDPTLRRYEKEPYEIGIYPSLGFLRVEVGMQCTSRQKLEKSVQSLEKDLEFFEDFFFKGTNLEEAVFQNLVEQKQTVSCAESCTGGNLAAKLVKLPGISQVFPGSFVTYSNAMKSHLLDVKETTLTQYGAVSEETVSEMLDGVLQKAKTDYAIAISGIAGPEGGMPDKPVGTVYIGIAKRGDSYDIGRVQGKGTRESIIEYSTNVALAALFRRIVKQKKTFS